MKRFLSKIFIFLGILSLVLGTLNSFGQNITYAQDLELIGTNLGLEIIPSDTRLFDLNRLNPGDRKEAKVTIKNNYSQAFQLYMRTERISPVPSQGEPDLFEQLILTVYLGDEEIYSGPMKNFAASNISLGRFSSGAIKDLRAVVYLPGPETGNEFQGENLEVKWIFTAQADAPPDPDPEDPEEPENPEVPEIPEEPEEPEVPETPVDPEEEIDEEIPQDVPELDDEEIIDEETPKDVPKMPKTGEIPSIVFYGLGMVMVMMGIGIKPKKEE